MCDTCPDRRGPEPARIARRSLLRGGVMAVGAAAVAPRLLAGPPPAAGAVAPGVAAPVALGPGEVQLASSSFAEPPAPQIIRRATWGADESLRSGTPSYAPIKKFLIHHTVTTNDEADPAARVRAIYQNHTVGRGWNDIAYNFLIDRQGRIYEGRFARTYSSSETPSGQNTGGDGVTGAHSFGHNTGSVGIAWLGTFGSTKPTAAQIDSAVRLIAWVAGPRSIHPHASDPYRRWDGEVVTFPNITGHSDVRATSCPGDGGRSTLAEIRARVAGILLSDLVGYRVVGVDGSIRSYNVRGIRDLPEMGINVSNIVGAAATPTGQGCWLAGSDGGVFALGDAVFLGSMGAVPLNKPVVGIAATPTGRGYWLVASDGGIFSFGDALFAGSTGNLQLNKPVVGMSSTPTGKGYWLVASDGGIFTFGDAPFWGSTGDIRLNQPVFGMAPTPTGEGYWMVARDGGMFTFGDARFLGSMPGRNVSWAPPAEGVLATPVGRGYLVVDHVGGVHPFGEAPFFGSGTRTSAAAVALLPVPAT